MKKNAEDDLAGLFRPVYGNTEATQEEMEACYVCIHCDEVKKDHMPDGACYFSPTQFEAKRQEFHEGNHKYVGAPVMRNK